MSPQTYLPNSNNDPHQPMISTITHPQMIPPLSGRMAYLLLATFLLFLSPAFSGPLSSPSIALNFTGSYLQFIDTSGAFLASRDNSFQARMTNPKPESKSFYFVIVHAPSNTIVWSANRNAPVSRSAQLRFTATGLALHDDSGHPVWSTPPNLPVLSSMRLSDSGNLVLLDTTNATVWQSFDSPTNVLVAGQRLRVGQMLVSSSAADDLSEGSYRLVIGNSDAMLQWNGLSYWKLSMDKYAFRDTNLQVDHMLMNYSGVYLLGADGEEIVIKVILPDSNKNGNSSNFQIVKLDHDGVFTVVSFDLKAGLGQKVFEGPDDRCRVPFVCRRLGLCTNGGSCQCAPAFHSDPKINNGDCVPSDASLALPVGPCNGSSSGGSAVMYLNLRNDLDYFANDFLDPVMYNVNLSACQSLCSSNCSCLGVFYSQGSGSCYLIQSFLGSLMIKSSMTDRVGYVKMTVVGISTGSLKNNKKSNFSVLPAVLLPSSGVIIIALIASLIYSRRRKMRWEKCESAKICRDNSSSSLEEEMDFVSIPGLPVRFNYHQLAEATRGFVTQIGSGGFGTVYKGTLKDGNEVAVKKMTCLGAQGKKEFLTEIAVIGNIHHVNLVKLKGFCANGGQRFLVYEYVKRGSLDRTLFRGEPVLNWNERYEVALGTARGLAYLHWGCEHKIIHCDIKPENILLHDKSQVKITDFGLSKLLSPEQSGLFTTLRGTRGYLAPEWLTSSSISDRTDVYSYGMVLLEIIRGKKNSHPQQVKTNNSNRGSVYFPLFALEMHEERRYTELVDPRLAGRVTNEEAEKLVRVALCCVHEEPNLRPSMTNVVGMLEGGVAIGEPRIDSLNFLRFYGRRFTEASMLGSGKIGEDNEVMLRRQATSDGVISSSYKSMSYMSSQEVSGPR